MSREHLIRAAQIAGSQKALAVAVGVTAQSLNQWISGVRPIPAERCPAIERATDGAVRCEDLRPDVDWAYLRGTDCPQECTHQKAA
jgi:DNA-binding transcriptional regulator YdaS (Cro superfamily)